MIKINPIYLKAIELEPKVICYRKPIPIYNIISSIDGLEICGRIYSINGKIEERTNTIILVDDFTKIENSLETEDLTGYDFYVKAIIISNPLKDLQIEMLEFRRNEFELKLLKIEKILKINYYNIMGNKILKTQIVLNPKYENLEEILLEQNLPKDLILQ